MFLVGGPAFSGTTLLALMLNQGGIVCLDEPDFHNPPQSHRAIPFLRSLFPDKSFPDRPEHPLTYTDAVTLMLECERRLGAYELGMKTCDRAFLSYAEIYRQFGFPVVGIFRDIRDALVRPLPAWVTEAGLNRIYREVWKHRNEFDAWVRYEDLVTDPEAAIAKISVALKRPLSVKRTWESGEVHAPMLKLDRHELLRDGAISSARVGMWKLADKQFSTDTIETASVMGYPEA